MAPQARRDPAARGPEHPPSIRGHRGTAASPSLPRGAGRAYAQPRSAGSKDASKPSRTKYPQQEWGLGAVAEEPRFTPGTSGVSERGRHRAALPEGSGQCPGRSDAAKGQGGRSGGPSRLQTLRSSRDRSTEAIWQRLGLPPCPSAGSTRCHAQNLLTPSPVLQTRGPHPANTTSDSAGRPSAKPDPSYGPSRVTTDPQNCSPQPGGLGVGATHPSEGPPDPGLPISSGHWRQSPGHRPPSGHAPAAALGGAGRKIKIPLAERAPVLSALFFSSKDTKEFQRGA